MSTDPFIGEIKILGFSFPPRGYSLCQGQLLSIASNSALFSLLGTTYGGNGTTTFALPDLQGRMPIGQGSGPGLNTIVMGEKAGTTSVSLNSSNLPPHMHTLSQARVSLQVNNATADSNTPSGAYLATTGGTNIYAEGPSSGTTLGPAPITGTTDTTGQGFPVTIANPYLGVNFSIATQGIFPSRN